MFALQLANVLSTEALFYACILPFIAFFGSFAFIMYPLRDVLHPTSKSSPNPFAQIVLSLCGSSFDTLAKMFHGEDRAMCLKARSGAAFLYCLSAEKGQGDTSRLFQMWGSVVVSLLFWGFANQVCSLYLTQTPQQNHILDVHSFQITLWLILTVSYAY